MSRSPLPPGEAAYMALLALALVVVLAGSLAGWSAVGDDQPASTLEDLLLPAE